MTNSASALHFALSRVTQRGSGSGGTLLYDAIYATAKQVLAKETGRKAMVILTDGGDNGSHKTIEEAVEQAQRADVQIYSVLYSMRNSLSAGNTGIPPRLILAWSLAENVGEYGGHEFTVSRTQSLRDIFSQIGQDLRLQYNWAISLP